MVIFTGISYRSVWAADKYLRYGVAPTPQTDHPYIQFDKLEVDDYLLVNLPNSANKAAANIHSTKISVSAIKSAEKIHPITSDKTGMIIANIR